MPLPDAYDYIALGMMAPEPEEPDDCTICGEYYCRPDCKPRHVSPYYAARCAPRTENRTPEGDTR